MTRRRSAGAIVGAPTSRSRRWRPARTLPPDASSRCIVVPSRLRSCPGLATRRRTASGRWTWAPVDIPPVTRCGLPSSATGSGFGTWRRRPPSSRQSCPVERILGARRRRGGRSGSPSLRTSMSSSSSNPWTRLPPSGVWRGSPRYRGPPGPEAWLVLTKTDLVAPGIVEETLTGMGPWVDAAVGVTSADPASTERLRTLLPKGATAVLVGRSGAGKSTLLNTILGVDHATGEVRSSDSKGRLDSERLGRYQRMLRESARLAARSDARHAREQERRASRNDSRGRRGVMRLTGC